MEHPEKEIKQVIRRLTTGTRAEQADALATYFLPDAAFAHPFCRVPGFAAGAVPFLPGLSSRWLLLCVYRWYRTLSPSVAVEVRSAVRDEAASVLYADVAQTFRLWFVPGYRADVRLVTVLRLRALDAAAAEAAAAEGAVLPPPALRRGPANGAGDGRLWYVASQEDLYQVNEFARFVLPWGLANLVGVWQLWSTAACVVLAVLFAPLARTMERIRAR